MSSASDTRSENLHLLPGPGVEIEKPELHPKLVEDEREALAQAAARWVKQSQELWHYIHEQQAQRVRRYARLATGFRVSIIALTALLTTVSAVDRAHWFITLTSGLISVLVGLETFFKFSESGAQIQQQQRELQARYDELTSVWATDVQLNPNLPERLLRAKALLREAPKAYNDILNKYAFSEQKNTSEHTAR